MRLAAAMILATLATTSPAVAHLTNHKSHFKVGDKVPYMIASIDDPVSARKFDVEATVSKVN